MSNIERRDLNVIFSKSGSGSPTTKLSIPIWWLNLMNITKDDRSVIASYDFNKKEITIKKG